MVGSNSERSTREVFPPGPSGDSGREMGGVALGDDVGFNSGPRSELSVGEMGTSMKPDAASLSGEETSSKSTFVILPFSKAAIRERSEVEGAIDPSAACDGPLQERRLF